MLWLQVMRHPDKVKRNQTQKKRSVKISFPKQEGNEGSAAEGNIKAAQTEVTPASEVSFGSPKTHHFEEVVCQLAQLCLVHVNEGKSESHLVFLSLLLRSFHTPKVFAVSWIYLRYKRKHCADRQASLWWFPPILAASVISGSGWWTRKRRSAGGEDQ